MRASLNLNTNSGAFAAYFRQKFLDTHFFIGKHEKWVSSVCRKVGVQCLLYTPMQSVETVICPKPRQRKMGVHDFHDFWVSMIWPLPFDQ